MKNLKTLQKAMDKKAILKGVVKMVQSDNNVLVLDLDGTKGIIPRDEVDAEIKWKSLVNFVGREINYIIKSIEEENNLVICSRKEAQVIQKEIIVSKLKEGEVFSAKVIKILRYGAYVDIRGITGLLKNADFSEDYTTVDDILKVGDTVNIKLKKITDNGKLVFESVEKFKNAKKVNIDEFEPNQVVVGIVRSVQSWGIYVRLECGIDALCPIPGTGEIEEGMKVRFKINQIKFQDENKDEKLIALESPEDKKANRPVKIRGKILSVI